MSETREEYLLRRKAYYNKNKEKISKQNKVIYLKNIDSRKNTTAKYKQKNKEKIRHANKEYNFRMKDIQSAKSKERYKNNGAELSKRQRERRANRTPEQKQAEAEYRKAYREKNRHKLYEAQKSRRSKNRNHRREYHKNKYRTDIQYKIQHNLRSRIKNIGKVKVKDTTCLNLLGCTVAYFEEYFSGLFKDGMSWELFMKGEIHIDHIKPCAKFDLTNPEEQKKCFHYTNLQPLFKLDNLKKHAKYEELKID